jgi:hypothetical protein
VTAGSARQYTGFPNPAMAFFAHPKPGSVITLQNPWP